MDGFIIRLEYFSTCFAHTPKRFRLYRSQWPRTPVRMSWGLCQDRMYCIMALSILGATDILWCTLVNDQMTSIAKHIRPRYTRLAYPEISTTSETPKTLNYRVFRYMSLTSHARVTSQSMIVLSITYDVHLWCPMGG
jgi:hypothetical protein